MKTRKQSFLSRFEAIHQRLALQIFRHVIRDNTFGMEYNYLTIPSRSSRQAESRSIAKNR